LLVSTHFFFRGGGVSFLPERAEMYCTPLGVTFEITGVAPVFVAPSFNLPTSLGEGDAGAPLREDLT
jgi:hypothetical protein